MPGQQQDITNVSGYYTEGFELRELSWTVISERGRSATGNASGYFLRSNASSNCLMSTFKDASNAPIGSSGVLVFGISSMGFARFSIDSPV